VRHTVLRLELSLLNHRVATEVGLNDVDLDCLEVISREGPTSPAQLARRLGIHPATMTGILSRLEDAGWIVRRVNPNDRRASVLKIVARREARLRKRYASSTQAVVDAMSARRAATGTSSSGCRRSASRRSGSKASHSTTSSLVGK
jgi:DNA-binding MarR family transcriptional regulator